MVSCFIAGAGVLNPKQMILIALIGHSLTFLAGIVNVQFMEHLPLEVNLIDHLDGLFGGFSKC
jgi:hypothetical protein